MVSLLPQLGTGLLVWLALISSSCSSSLPQIPPGEDPLRWLQAIQAFEASDRLDPAPQDAALFVGSSSIRRWDTLTRDMAPMPVIQRGFGGSRLFDSVYFADRLVVAYDPAVIVIFSGTNDISGDHPKSAKEVCALFQRFVGRVRAENCGAPIVYIAISPTRARLEHIKIVLEANRLIAASCEPDTDLYFVDTARILLDPAGLPDRRWFVEDGLHLNSDGYALWTMRVRPLLAKLLQAPASR
ncbi:MAG TPA: hypothetical protein EYQ25_06480 [Planctomycetes bacterium]|nr:hypothetical protein [Planctomycetota bacterium]HIL37322.1 hypothetical protein [Planctomycetota bacterium]